MTLPRTVPAKSLSVDSVASLEATMRRACADLSGAFEGAGDIAGKVGFAPPAEVLATGETSDRPDPRQHQVHDG
jgi:hypothetical protein